MDKEIRNKLRNVVTNCRKLLEESIGEQLQGHFGIHADGKIEDESNLTLSEEDIQYRHDILDHFEHIKALGYKAKDSLAQLIREIAFTHLNRFCAYKMMAARDVVIGSKKFRDPIGSGNKTGPKSNAFMFYLADHPDEEKLANSGKQDRAYRHFLDWVGEQLSEEIGVLFNSNDPANRLYPPQRVLDEIFDLLNKADIKDDETELKEQWPKIWSEDETIGWVYQYFTPKELRDRVRKESRAPRNSNELAFRNQFFTPRYVVEFLTDNSLGRTWYEMQQGSTRLVEQCQFMVRRPKEVFLAAGEQAPSDPASADSSQEELLTQPVFIPYRSKKDPREIRILDPACGSGHFLLYCFDLLLTIYDEAYEDSEIGPILQQDFPDAKSFRNAIPGLILANNLFGIDIDRRASQIAALAMWLRCQRDFDERNIKDRPKITKSNLVCAEPMPGDTSLLTEFVKSVTPKFIGKLITDVFESMKLAGDAGALLKLESELRQTIATARQQMLDETTKATDSSGRELMFSKAEIDRTKGGDRQQDLFDVADVTDAGIFDRAEQIMTARLEEFLGKSPSHRNKLFANDTARGLAFVETLLHKFDVVIMNPPFGMCAKSSKKYVEETYPDSKGDILAHFIERGLQLVNPNGFVAAISSRTCFYITRLADFRQKVLSPKTSLDCLVDFGEGVLDATVETASYILRKNVTPGQQCQNTLFLRKLLSQEKGEDLKNDLDCINSGKCPVDAFLINVSEFSNINGSPYAYWASPKSISIIEKLPPIQGNIATVRVGLQTGEDARFLRLFWEVPPNSIGTIFEKSDLESHQLVTTIRSAFTDGKRWAFYSKTDYASPWVSPQAFLVDWEHDGQSLKNHIRQRGYSPSKWVQSESKYFRPGFSYMVRSTRLVPYIVPPGVIPMAVRSTAFPEQGKELTALSICASRIGSAIARFSGGAFARPMFQASMVQNIPSFKLAENTIEQVGAYVDSKVKETRRLISRFEPWLEFAIPAYLDSDATEEVTWKLESLLGDELEKQIEADAGFDPDESKTLCRDLDEAIEIRTRGDNSNDKDENDDDDDQSIIDFSERAVAEGFISYLVGVVVGRWDVRLALNHDLLPTPYGLNDPPPACPPGTLFAPNGLPAESGNIVSEEWIRKRPNGARIPSEAEVKTPTISDDEYPIRIDWDGILVDDESHEDDLVTRVQEILSLLCPGSTVEETLCKQLGSNTLRDYFRKPTKNGFFDDHVNRYKAKRGRKAPIYWLLQSAKKSFGIWLYYHRLDKDMLFKVVKNYVEPKLQREDNRLQELQSEKSSAGDNAREVRRLEREIEKQEELIAEVQQFADKIRDVAELQLEPDLHDGVSLNIAPLREVAVWKDAKKHWKSLMDGKNEWSTIGKQLREKGLVDG